MCSVCSRQKVITIFGFLKTIKVSHSRSTPAVNFLEGKKLSTHYGNLIDGKRPERENGRKEMVGESEQNRGFSTLFYVADY